MSDEAERLEDKATTEDGLSYRSITVDKSGGSP